jgi:hypothetical protein
MKQHHRRRNTARKTRLAGWLIAACVLAVLPGCNFVVLFGYLIGGPPSIEPDFDVMTGKSMTGKDVTVAVVCYAPMELQYDFHAIDNEIAKYVTFRLNQHHIKVVNPDQIRAWLDEHSGWDRPDEIGRAFGVKYVVYIDVSKYSLYEESSANLYRGRAEGMVSVFEMDETGEGEKIYSKEILSKFPLAVPRSASETTYSRFKREYLSRLSDEIGRLFYEYYNGDDIPDAT